MKRLSDQKGLKMSLKLVVYLVLIVAKANMP